MKIYMTHGEPAIAGPLAALFLRVDILLRALLRAALRALLRDLLRTLLRATRRLRRAAATVFLFADVFLA